MNVFKHYSYTFLETIAEFYDFSAFNLFLSFDHVFGCITITIEIENTPFLLHLTKMFSKTNTWQQVINLCQSWEIILEMKWELFFFDTKCLKTYLICIKKIMTLPDQVLIFLTIVDKVVVNIYARFQLSIKLMCKDIHSSIEKCEESQLAILFLL